MRASRCDSSSITDSRSSRSPADSAPSRRPPAAVVIAVSGERKSCETAGSTAVLATPGGREGGRAGGGRGGLGGVGGAVGCGLARPGGQPLALERHVHKAAQRAGQ